MIEAWKRFENWLTSHYKEAHEDLNPPASDEQIRALEEALSVTLPADFAQFLKAHNGQAGDAGWIIDGSELLSVERIIDEWQVWHDLLINGHFDDYDEERNNGVKNDWWNAKWIPFTYDGGGNHLCLDLDPAKDGHHGQIITMWHDDSEREVQATSFHAWFTQYVDDIEAGKYVYSADYEAVVNANDV